MDIPSPLLSHKLKDLEQLSRNTLVIDTTTEKLYIKVKPGLDTDNIHVLPVTFNPEDIEYRDITDSGNSRCYSCLTDSEEAEYIYLLQLDTQIYKLMLCKKCMTTLLSDLDNVGEEEVIRYTI